MVTSWFVGIVLLFCLTVGTLVFVQYHLQNTLDNIALSGACQLNSKGQIGQMNNMVGRCRQLVYSSRQTETSIAQQKPILTKLASQLLDEVRTSATDLEKERANLVISSSKAAEQAINTQFDKTCAQQTLVLPWLKMSKPVLVATQFGSVNDVDSNVAVLDGIPALLTNDQGQHIIHTQPSLYDANINAKLPAPDEDLSFNLSSLPAYTNNITPPARLLLPAPFVVGGQNNQLSSAVQITAQIKLSTVLGPGAAATLNLVSTATTFGGGPVQ